MGKLWAKGLNTHIGRIPILRKIQKRGYQLCLLGKGDIPLERMYQILQEEGYAGYYTLEWEKRWWPDIEEPEIAFSQYTSYMESVV